MATGNFSLSEHQLILQKLCQICGERLKKAKDKNENSFLCADNKEIIFTAFGVKIHEDDLETCPPPQVLPQMLQACFMRRYTFSN